MFSPETIARRLTSALKRDAAQLVHRVLAPNVFELRVSEEFMSHWGPLKARLEDELAGHLKRQASRLGADSLGPFQVRLLADPTLGPSGTHIESSFQRARPRPATLRAVSGLPSGLVYPLLRQETVIGRGEADLRLPEQLSQVSRRHARLYCQDGEFWLQDMGSKGGTFVNDRPVENTRLGDGDRISLGPVSLIFELPAASQEKAS